MELKVKVVSDDGQTIYNETFTEYTMEQMAIAVKSLKEQLNHLRTFEELIKK